MASPEKTEVNSVYLEGRVTLSLAFLAAIASSVAVVSLAMRELLNSKPSIVLGRSALALTKGWGL